MTGGLLRLSVSLRDPVVNLPAGALQAAKLIATLRAVQSLDYGTAAGQHDLLVVKSAVLSAGASVALNLYDASLTDVFGQAAALRKLRSAVVVLVSGGDAAGLDVLPGATNPCPLWFLGTNPGHRLKPGGPPYLGGESAGLSVGAATGTVKLLNNGAVSATYAAAFAGSTA